MENTEDKKWCVYKHTSPSKKIYIGITGMKPIERWGSDGRGYLSKNKNGEFRQPAIARAIIKYLNWDEWQHDIIATNLSLIEARKMECELIALYKCMDSNYGYNISPGGDGGYLSDETRRKISESKKGTIPSESARINMSNAQKQRWNQNAREEASKRYSGEGNPMFGVHRYGELNPMFGKKHSDDTKEKIRQANSGKNNVNSKAVVCLETETIYNSAKEAERMTGIKSQTILACCNYQPHRKTAGGFHWKFYDEHINEKEEFLYVL